MGSIGYDMSSNSVGVGTSSGYNEDVNSYIWWCWKGW
jgi:hypothetical protein